MGADLVAFKDGCDHGPLVFLPPSFQEDETDVSEEVKEALVSGKPVRHVPFASTSLMCIQF